MNEQGYRMPKEGAFALLLTGPAGAGKSAAARAWATARPGFSAHIQLDDVREQIIGGFADPIEGWSAQTQCQYEIARENCADMARRFVGEGIACVIDDAIFPLWEGVDYTGWRRLLADVPHMLVVLLPRYEVVVARNNRRQGRRLLAPALLRTIYDMMMPWAEQSEFPVIDNSALSLAETAQAIQRQVERLRPSLG